MNLKTDPASPKPGGPRRLRRGIAILYEDAELLVVDKPNGIITADPAVGDEGRHPAARAGNTVFDILKAHIREAAPGQRVRRTGAGTGRGLTRDQGIWIIHRLDKEASGLLVFAKTQKTFNWLKEDLKAKRINREYLAVAEGAVGEPGAEGTIQSFIADERSRRPERRPTPDQPPEPPKPAVTHYKVVAVGAAHSLARVRLETGRKNQIRLHFAQRGWPLAGDSKFGAKSDPIGRLALHAAELSFSHPATGQPMKFVSPAPETFYRSVGLAPPAPSTVEASMPPAKPAASPAPAPAVPRVVAPAPAVATSWDNVASWYDELLEDRGNDHYEQVILPGTLRLLEPVKGMRVLDVASGQGMLGRRLAALGVETLGVEASPQLVKAAERRSDKDGTARLSRSRLGDARELAAMELRGFDAAVCIMALSNIEPISPVMTGVAAALRPGGRFVWVIVHPAFRAARQTDWGWDEKLRRQYRRVDGYLSAGQTQIEMNPGKAARGGGTSPVTTWTFHRPIQTYVESLARAGLLVERLEEWPSLRASTSGPRADEENRARREIPMFLGVRAVKPG